MMIPVAAQDWSQRIQANGSSVGFGEFPSHMMQTNR
jgi:hypothetical protein